MHWMYDRTAATLRCSVADERDAGEGLLEVEFPLGVLLGQPVELLLVPLHLLDEIDEVTRLLELLQVLGIDHVSEFIFDADDELDNVERVETVVREGGVEGNGGLARRAEVILRDGDDILLDLVICLEHKCVLGRIGVGLPQVNLTGLLVGARLGARHNRILVQTQLLHVAHPVHRAHNPHWLQARAALLQHCNAESRQHFLLLYIYKMIIKYNN